MAGAAPLAQIVVMGVSGAGKSTTGRALAAKLGREFIEGDAFHPPANIRKIAAGIPLTDADRAPWLAALAAELRRADHEGRQIVLACSALKRSYREVLRGGAGRLRLVMVHGPRALLIQRLATRRGHFFAPELLDSQLATLELPGPDEDCVFVDLALPVAAQVEQAVRGLWPP
ncbi:gluconokinase [Paracoccus jeotgali]|uniref:Gluconokinase n=1 Tax=Paracoccus jeotgali TaxID=2065379 RepID=A0A2K9MH65_9RHOB|nr:gluconokinase [Paracoccus jeotgali]AUM74987.1 gluconate kinase [Paracoccus jeotgali]